MASDDKIFPVRFFVPVKGTLHVLSCCSLIYDCSFQQIQIQCQSPTDAKIPPSLPSSPTQLQYDISLHGQSLARRYTLLYTCGKLANLSLTENNETALKLGLCPFRGLEGRESYCQPRVLEGGRYLKTPTGRLPNLGPTEGEKQL